MKSDICHIDLRRFWIMPRIDNATNIFFAETHFKGYLKIIVDRLFERLISTKKVSCFLCVEFESISKYYISFKKFDFRFK